MNVAEAVGAILASLGVRMAFGVAGSGNFHVTNALIRHGVRYVAARNEGGAATMADAYARMSGTVAVLSVHQGPGFTNALTGITEAAKSRTPLLVLAPEPVSPHSNFRIDQPAIATAVGAHVARVGSAATVVDDTVMAFLAALLGRRTVVLALPLDVQEEVLPEEARDGVAELLARRGDVRAAARLSAGWGITFPAEEDAFADPEPAARTISRTGAASAARPGLVAEPAEAIDRLAGLLVSAERPVFVAGRGARGTHAELEALAEQVGALLATTAVAKGEFQGSPWNLDVMGHFSSPAAAELIRGADLIVGWGCSFTAGTTRNGTLIGERASVIQVDLDRDAIGVRYPVDLGVIGDVRETARAVLAALTGRAWPCAPDERRRTGYRTPEVGKRIATEVRWRDIPYADTSGNGRIDPRTLTIELDDLLPPERIVAVDSGNFMGYPVMLLSVPDGDGFCYTQAYQSVGLGLATAIGAALARPDRLPVAALGDGGALMGISELETVVRLGLPMVIVVYDDEAYGAEVHHFGPQGEPLDTVTFPPTDFARIARGFGCDAVTVRSRADLVGVAKWLHGPRDRPLLVHAKITKDVAAWWLPDVFRVR